MPERCLRLACFSLQAAKGVKYRTKACLPVRRAVQTLPEAETIHHVVFSQYRGGSTPAKAI